jgi:predicted nuclease of restriction endonuclease-like (RecB) superfamily
VSKKRKNLPEPVAGTVPGYDQVLGEVVQLLEQARRASARAVNAYLTSTYWDIGRRIVEFEQGGKDSSQYGAKLLERLSADLTAKFGRGFSYVNLTQMRRFYLAWPRFQNLQTPSEEFAGTAQALSETTEFPLSDLTGRFPLPWSHYVLLLKVEKPEARAFYEAEAHRNGWTVRQLERQITTLFYERTLASRNKGAMLKKAAIPKPGEELTPEEEIKDPFVLEFLGLKDEYSESELEEALIRELETFLLELGGDFAFVGRQKRLRIGDEWYRIDLLFFHRKLRCLVVIDLKLGKFTHADACQMQLNLNYARENWTNDGENPPVGVILCTQKDMAVVHYALENLPNKVLAAEYQTTLPNEKTLAAELETKRRLLESRSKTKKGGQA